MKQLAGACLALIGIVLASRMLYERYVDGREIHDWYWYLVALICFVIGGCYAVRGGD